MTNALISDLFAEQRHFGAVGRVEGGRHVVHVSGELDIAGRETLILSCARAEQPLDVVVDLAELTFLDCCGYGALVTARSSLTRQGGTLTLTNGVGEPARLIAMITRLDACAEKAVENAVGKAAQKVVVRTSSAEGVD